MLRATPCRPIARAPLRPVVIVLVAWFIGAGCKPAHEAEVPGAPAVSDDIAEIEARLASNHDALRAEGIYVAEQAVSPPAGREDGAAGDDAPVGGDAAPDIIQEEAVVETDEDEGEDAPEPEPQYEPTAPAEASKGRPSERVSQRSPRDRRLDRRRSARRQAERCERICDLAEATCGLADRVCDLASRHPDEVRYENACASAEAQCDAASDACTACAQ